MNGEQPRTVVVALISGGDSRAYTHPATKETRESSWANWFDRTIAGITQPQGLLLVGDCENANLSSIYNRLSEFQAPVAGCLSPRLVDQKGTSAQGQNQSAACHPSTVIFNGMFRMGVGIGHGWKDVGLNYQIDQVEGLRIKKMAESTPTEIYSRIFDQPVGEWGSLPLSELIRLYPLGLEIFPGSNDFNLRSPLAVEPDGSFLMNAPVTEGQIAHLFVGDPDACLEAARVSTIQAIRDLDSAEPLLALVFIDIAWHYLFKNRPETLCEAIQDELGDIPFIGAYTSGQIHRPSPEVAPQIFNQHFLMVLLGRS